MTPLGRDFSYLHRDQYKPMIEEKVSQLVQSGRTREALAFLMAATESDSMLNDQVITLSARLQADRSNHSLGIIDYKTLRGLENQLTLGIQKLTRTIAAEDYAKDLTLADIQARLDAKAGKQERTKILFVGVNSPDHDALQLEKEYLGLRKIFRQQRDQFELTELFDASLDDLFAAIQQEKPDILHIAAHSSLNKLVLIHPTGKANHVPWSFLASAALMFQEFCQCVFINTQVTPVFLKKVSRSLPFAIGASRPVTDRASIDFSSGFYTGLSLGKEIPDAFTLGIQMQQMPHIVQTDQAEDPALKQGGLTWDTSNENEPFESAFMLFRHGTSVNRPDTYPEDFSPQKK